MKKEDLEKIVEGAVSEGMQMHRGFTGKQADDYISEKIFYAIQQLDQRKETMKECFDKFLECKTDKEFTKWIVNQIK